MVVARGRVVQGSGRLERGRATNAAGTANVVKAAQAAGVERLIYFQTALCYGLQPLEQPITLDHPLPPGGVELRDQQDGRRVLRPAVQPDWVSFRLANAYGPRNLSGPLPTFFHRLTTGKPCFVMDTRRDFIYVDDLVDLVVQAVDGAGRRGVYHVSSGSRLRDQGALRRDREGARHRAGRGRSRCAPRNPDDVFTILLDPSQDQPGLRLEGTTTPLERGRRGARSTTTAQFGIEETYTHLKLAEREADRSQ